MGATASFDQPTGLGVAGQQVEERGHVGGDVAVAGHQADVGVEPGGAVVVVAGGQVDVAVDALRLAADDQQRLGVRLEAGDAVDHVARRRLPAAAPS